MIYLHDKLNGSYTDIKNNTFSIVLGEGIHNERFEITFSKQSTLSKDIISISDFKFFENTKTSEIEIINPQRFQIQQVIVYDITGKRVLTNSLFSNKRKNIISSKPLNSGVYIVSLKLQNNQVVHKKMIISGN